ncbi:hypothetical protein AVEN_112115-1 [Araneus ventricosus]|uniref:Uncharacterized protein n=1 Tax=Araneus ventricosus TaxID=182803 RepID=A0A4Y2FN88_ARAVE|nr:hypothetical protein AVEN_112115-1 [Araneus ventricosus]
MDDLPVNRSSPVRLEMPTNNPVDKNNVQDGPTSKRAESSKAVVDQKVCGNKNVLESSKSGEKKSGSLLPAKRSLDKSSKPTASGANKVAKTKASRDKSPTKKKAAASRDKSPTKKKVATSRDKSPTKKKAAASKDKKPKKSPKETGKKAKPDQKTKPATRSTTKKL